ncbi:MAG: hypothetical protein GIX03_06240 [Candidatus Eremiobacteraeota bacterium]|nr:hypothetical protein [Candidatus Eremiobacteraeota bacterium]MBC5802595.1 hypothetical protein [Candidatus Eremiobacteraeota bacterium]MBC5821459.1 hypothetical protein [Candidatus Eremiobacteraeota bacterium]
MSEPRIEITDLGTWGTAALLAEYDPQGDVIRVNARAVERIRAACTAAEAAQFVTCAIAHERYHRAHPAAGEHETRHHAAAVSGLGEERLLVLLRAGARAPSAAPHL